MKATHYLLRHGDTEANDQNVFRSMLDVSLNEKGVLQAHAAGEFLKNKQIERIICSPLHRAFQTAQIVSATIGGRHITQERELFPWKLPNLMGKDRDENEYILNHLILHPELQPEFGESLDDFCDRIGDYFEEVLRSPVPTLFVAHTSDIVTLRCLIKGEKPAPEAEEVVLPGGIVELCPCTSGYEFKPVFRASSEHESAS